MIKVSAFRWVPDFARGLVTFVSAGRWKKRSCPMKRG